MLNFRIPFHLLPEILIMKTRILIVGFLFAFNFGSIAQKTPVNFLSVAAPIIFDKQYFLLSWTAHPVADLYKQEYLAKGDNIDHYKRLFMIDLMTTGDIKLSVDKKVKEINNLKASNPLVNFELIKNPSTGEYMLDFILSANNADGSISILERNVYRYKTVKNKKGKLAVLMVGVSDRAYGAAGDVFLKNLGKNRKDLMSQLSGYKLPLVEFN